MPTRFVNVDGRAGIVVDGRVIDLETRSAGKLPADPTQAIARWDEVCTFAAGARSDGSEPAETEVALGPPVSRPPKVFAVALNYRGHAQEAGLEIPKEPLLFTKFPNCIAGPDDDVVLTGPRVDYEVELVAVIGRRGRDLSGSDVLASIAGYCVGQDISDRRLQFNGKPPQFSMGKSADTYGPIGPALVSLDAFADPLDLAIRCEVNGEMRQEDRTSDMIFSVVEQIEFVSRFCTLEPGDLIFTGTPSGIGAVRDPSVYLTAGDVVTSTLEGVGTITNRCVLP
jgi:2-keto-4-pentenoate hydratase/2-oxohepta-3-ene-1,7-dioic acid hydratase in catechol pathway